MYIYIMWEACLRAWGMNHVGVQSVQWAAQTNRGLRLNARTSWPSAVDFALSLPTRCSRRRAPPVLSRHSTRGGLKLLVHEVLSY